MRVISKTKEELKSRFPVRVHCQECLSELEIEEEDLMEGYDGMFYFTCPVCNQKSYVNEDIKSTVITKDTIKFPTHFYDFRNGVSIKHEEVERWILEGVNFLRNNPDEYHCIHEAGNTAVLIEKYIGDQNYTVTVAQGYYQAEIPFEQIDYEVYDEEEP